MKNEYEEEHDFDCCSLCLDGFKDPRILPCFHSLCRNCLADYLAKKVGSTDPGTTFECPLCRAKSDVPKEGIDGIQKNFYLEKTKSIHPMCAEHDNEDLRFYCRNCDLKICRDCKVISHEGHVIDMTKKVFAEVKSKCEDILNVTERDINKREIEVRGAIEPDILALDTKLASTDEYVARIKVDIDSFVKDMRDNLLQQQSTKRNSLVKIEACFDEKRKKIAEKKQWILQMLTSEERDSVIKLSTDFVAKVGKLNIEEEPSFLAEHGCISEVDTSGFESEFRQLKETICSALKEFKLHVSECRKDKHEQDDELKGACALKDSEDESSESSDYETSTERVGPSKSMNEMLSTVQTEEAHLKSEIRRRRSVIPDNVSEMMAGQENLCEIIASQKNKNGEDFLQPERSKTKENDDTKNRRSKRVVPEIKVIFNDCAKRGARRDRRRLREELREPRERNRNSFRFRRDMNSRAPRFDDENDFPMLLKDTN